MWSGISHVTIHNKAPVEPFQPIFIYELDWYKPEIASKLNITGMASRRRTCLLKNLTGLRNYCGKLQIKRVLVFYSNRHAKWSGTGAEIKVLHDNFDIVNPIVGGLHLRLTANGFVNA